MIGKAQADPRNASGKAILPFPFFGGEKQDTETKRSFPNIYEVRKTGSQSPAKKAQGCGECEDSADGTKSGPMYLGMSESQKGMFLMTGEGRSECEGG